MKDITVTTTTTTTHNDNSYDHDSSSIGLKQKINTNQDILDLKINFVNKNNINEILKSSQILKNYIEKKIDFFSIDIDSYDIDCLLALTIIKPRLICIEYNAKFNQNIKLEINKINDFDWKYDDYFGSSLGLINEKLEKINYKLIATNITGSNAFYVTNELVDKCKTKGQTLEQLYSPANFELFNYNVAHAPTNKYLIDKLNEQKNFNSN